jgi:pycsar effector protein
MKINDRRDVLEKNLISIHNWILGLDQKVMGFIALQGIILALLIPGYLKSITDRFKTPHAITFINAVLVIISAGFLGYSIFKSLSAIYPRIGKKKTNKSHLYFGGITNYTSINYKQDMRKITENEYIEELIDQTYINAGIAERKHKEFRDAIKFFVIGMVIFIICYISLKFF